MKKTIISTNSQVYLSPSFLINLLIFFIFITNFIFYTSVKIYLKMTGNMNLCHIYLNISLCAEQLNNLFFLYSFFLFNRQKPFDLLMNRGWKQAVNTNRFLSEFLLWFKTFSKTVVMIFLNEPCFGFLVSQVRQHSERRAGFLVLCVGSQWQIRCHWKHASCAEMWEAFPAQQTVLSGQKGGIVPS